MLGSKAIGDGSYELAGIGNVFIKNPEIGMTSYFSGDKAWLWDSGGLAQPLPDPLVQNSSLRHFSRTATGNGPDRREDSCIARA
jgi:hypothetical protein